MKRSWYALAIFLSSVVWGQSIGTINSNARPLGFNEHPLHAERHDMRPETNLLGGNITVDHGERPLWEIQSLLPIISLGEFARHYRLIHKDAEKSPVVYTNQ